MREDRVYNEQTGRYETVCTLTASDGSKVIARDQDPQNARTRVSHELNGYEEQLVQRRGGWQYATLPS